MRKTIVHNLNVFPSFYYTNNKGFIDHANLMQIFVTCRSIMLMKLHDRPSSTVQSTNSSFLDFFKRWRDFAMLWHSLILIDTSPNQVASRCELYSLRQERKIKKPNHRLSIWINRIPQDKCLLRDKDCYGQYSWCWDEFLSRRKWILCCEIYSIGLRHRSAMRRIFQV